MADMTFSTAITWNEHVSNLVTQLSIGYAYSFTSITLTKNHYPGQRVCAADVVGHHSGW